MEKQEQATHVTMPVEVFNELMNTVAALPYLQVSGLIKKVEQGARAINSEEDNPVISKKEITEKKEK